MSVAATTDSQVIHVQDLSRPAFLMCPPLGITTDVANNVYMERIPESERAIDRARALDQYMAFTGRLAQDALLYQLPVPLPLQDQCFTSNVGIVPPHVRGVAVMSSFCSEPRRGEERIAGPYLDALGYEVVYAPELFEGEADIKYLGDGTYVAAHGMRTSLEFGEWFASTFDAQVIPARLHDPECYHLDCVILPLPGNRAAVCCDLLDGEVVRAIEKVADVIDVSEAMAKQAVTNCIVLGDALLCDSNIRALSSDHADYAVEREKVEAVERIAAFVSLQAETIDTSEFWKSGAALSCMVMHLNRVNYGLVAPPA